MNVEKIKSQNTGIYCKYNTRLKTFSDGSIQLKIYNYDLHKGIYKYNKQLKIKNELEKKKEEEHRRHKTLLETKQKIIDLAYENAPWEYFLTLTFDDQLVDGYDYDRVVEELTKWINNMKHQNPHMSYIIAPELHPTSGRVHFHGIFKNVPKWSLKGAINPHTNKPIYQNGKRIYNLENYKLGFSTVSKVSNQEAVSVYISKYVTKELIEIKYKKRFWASKNLSKPKVEYANFDPDTEAFFILTSNEIKSSWQGKNSKQYWLT